MVIFSMLSFCMSVDFEHISHIVLCSNHQGLYDGEFCENNCRLLAVHYFSKKLHYRDHHNILWGIAASPQKKKRKKERKKELNLLFLSREKLYMGILGW